MTDPYKPFGRKYGGKVVPGLRQNPVVTAPYRRVESTGPTTAKFVNDTGTAGPVKTYTGDKLLGIGTMHKSNAVPVFSSEQATDIAKMRRG